MIDFLKTFKSLLKLEKIRIDNNTFRLHYRFTVMLLIVSSILVTSKQYFGDPIICDIPNGEKEQKTIETYCWIFGTFTLKTQLSHGYLRGLGTYVDRHDSQNPVDRTMNLRNDDEVISHRYYQWICITLLLQALMFYIPRYLWKNWEGDRIRLLVKDYGSPVISPNWTNDNRDRLISYMLSGKYSHDVYCVRFVVCEFLNLINVVSQIILTNYFFNGNFLYYGYNMIMNDYTFPSSVIEIFPKLAKCTYFRYGASGSIESRDALCVLPLNVVNEKLYTFLWIWFYALTVVSAISLIYRAIFLMSRGFRVYMLMAQTRYTSRSVCEAVVSRLSFGDYFVLTQLGRNLNPIIYKDLVLGLGNVLLEKSTLPYNPEITMSV